MGRDPLDTDDVFDVLRAERRREALRVLSDQKAPLALAALADEVAVREHQAPVRERPAEDIERLYFELYHCHVPKLADRGIVDYHQEGDTVAPTENVGYMTAYLHLLDRVDTTTGTDS